ncbi:MAG: protein-disulfide reductase DsbD [Gammaproteobacteria bacterium]|nr:protein-disulfide reductase DsbD [Gammaproteobacteria bacterium]
MLKRIGFVLLFFFVASAFALKQPLRAEQAFKLSTHQAGKTVVAEWTIAPGYHLYKDRLKFEFEPAKQIKEGVINFPATQQAQDPSQGAYEVYTGHLKIVVPFSSAITGEGKLKVSFQGCADAGFCYPPMSQVVPLALTAEANADIAQNSSTSLFQTDSSLLLLIGFFGFGLLLSFTPCVLPMIPILSSIILGQGKLNSFRAFILSGTYVLGMSVAYAIAGVLASLAGGHLQAYMQSPLILTVFSVMFVLLALSLFGLYDIRMPNFFHHHVTRLSNKQKSGSLVGVFVMGFLSILIVSPCVSAPLVAALSLISQKGSLVLGAIALWVMGVGMGVPLLIIGTFGPQLLPKTGKWMDAVKAAFGVVMLGLAIMLLSRFLPGFIVLVMWAGLFIVTAVSMGIFTPLPAKGTGRVWHGLGYILFVYGIILLVGAAHGNSDPLMPLGRENTVSEAHHDLNFQTVKSVGELKAALAQAKGRYTMVDFSAEWCMACRELDEFTFSNASVKEKLKDMLLIRADITDVTPETKALQAKFGVVAPPTLVFFDPTGRCLKGKTIVGEVNADDFLKQIQTIK